MTSILLQGWENINVTSHDPEEKIIITGVTWEAYEQLLNQLGNQSTYRITYLEGTLEIMSPSRKHELTKENIGRLLEVYLDEAEIDFWGLGSTTLRKREKEAGKEPDKCYCLETEKEFPDLAIEVIITSGGTDSLAVYQRLEVKEVWFWYQEKLSIYHLNESGNYIEVDYSYLLPNLDIQLLSNYISYSNPRIAMREYRSQVLSKS